MTRARRAPRPSGDGIVPTPERWNRGDVEALPHAIQDEAGRPARPYRRVDTLALMMRKGTISAAMRQAGDDFHALFVRAALEPLRAADLMRMPHGQQPRDLGDTQMEARRRVVRTLERLGGIASPAGSCLWHVVGCEWSVKEWALREGWGGRPISQEQAAGVLVAALGALAAPR